MAKDLQTQQLHSLWLDGRPPLKSLTAARKFMESVGICLRYWPTKGLPMASIYQAASGKDKKEIGQPRAIDLTNQLLENYDAIEVSVIAGRICLVHPDVMPALYCLVTRGHPIDAAKLSPNARRAYHLIEDKGQASAGDVRKALGEARDLREDPAYLALAELQRHLLVDRGPFKRPGKGIPYLPKEGYPYHLFYEAHMDIVSTAGALKTKDAAHQFVMAYLNGAQFCSAKKMVSMFKLFLSPEEIDKILPSLESEGKIRLEKKGKELVAFLA